MIDVSSLKIVSISEIPPTFSRGGSQWDVVFEQVPKGKAVILEQVTHPYRIRSALQHQQQKDRFTTLEMVQRKQPDGSFTVFIVNPENPKAAVSEKEKVK